MEVPDQTWKEHQHGQTEECVIGGDEVAVHGLPPAQWSSLGEQQSGIELARLARLLDEDGRDQDEDVETRSVVSRSRQDFD